MAVNTINFRWQDAESDTKYASTPIYVPTGFTLAEYQAFATAAAPTLDAATESKLASIDMNLSLTVPGGLKGAPVASALNERGGLIGYDTAGQFNDSFRVPAILHTIMSGDSFSTANAQIAAITALLVAGNAVIFPRTRDGFVWSAAIYGRKSLRRK